MHHRSAGSMIWEWRDKSMLRTFLRILRNSLLLNSWRVACLVRSKKSSPFKSTTVWLISSSLIFRIVPSSSSRWAMFTTTRAPLVTKLRTGATDSAFTPWLKNGDAATDTLGLARIAIPDTDGTAAQSAAARLTSATTLAISANQSPTTLNPQSIRSNARRSSRVGQGEERNRTQLGSTLPTLRSG
jgi:hypothetical protein